MSVNFVKPVLIVEDSPAIARVVSRSIITRTGHPTKVVHSYVAALSLIRKSHFGTDFLAAVVDLVLPDALGGEIVDLTLGAGIPTIVLTGKYNDNIRQKILSKDVVDYFFKSEGSLDLLSETIWRLEINQDIRILIVNSAEISGASASRLLNIHGFQVIEERRSDHALLSLEENAEVTLVIVCHQRNTPADIEMVTQIRRLFPFYQLGIIVVSDSDSSVLAGRFLKVGADDFVKRPFGKEEFYSRIYRGIKTLESIHRLQQSAYMDQLTNLYNRLYFFKTAPALYEAKKDSGELLTLAMIDIDYFKNINDKYGHEAGDLALRQAAYLLRDNLEAADIIARFGGEEFCVLLSEHTITEARQLFENLRRIFETTTFRFGGNTLRFTVSVGVTTHFGESLDKMIGQADRLLYNAKEKGRNQVCAD